MYKKAEPLYGAPRGNRVMKAKRVHGQSAQTILNTHVFNEHCHVKGCKNHVLVTKHPNMDTRERSCAEHVSKVGTGRKTNVRDLLKLPWEA